MLSVSRNKSLGVFAWSLSEFISKVNLLVRRKRVFTAKSKDLSMRFVPCLQVAFLTFRYGS